MPAPPAAKPRGHVTAEGVFEELSIVRPRLLAHQQTLAPKLIPPLAARIKYILPALGVKFEGSQLNTVSQEIAAETARETLENLGRIQDTAQIPQLVADSLTQSIVTHPAINPDLNQIAQEKPPKSADEEKIYQKVEGDAQQITKEHATDLEQAAVLKNIDNIADLATNKQNQQVTENEINNFVQENTPSNQQSSKENITGQVAGYLQIYDQNIAQTLVPQITSGNIPTLAQLGQIKNQVHAQSLATLKLNLGTKQTAVDSTPVIENIAHLTSLKPITVDHARRIGLGNAEPTPTTFADPTNPNKYAFALRLATSTRAKEEGFDAALATNPQRLSSNIPNKAK